MGEFGGDVPAAEHREVPRRDIHPHHGVGGFEGQICLGDRRGHRRAATGCDDDPVGAELLDSLGRGDRELPVSGEAGVS